jgi:hypothetical protein
MAFSSPSPERVPEEERFRKKSTRAVRFCLSSTGPSHESLSSMNARLWLDGRPWLGDKRLLVVQLPLFIAQLN